jgi:DNA-binding transcriptional ArsR family regulator
MIGMTGKTTYTPSGKEMVLTDADREILAAPPADERALIERAMRERPELTVEKALEALRAFSI